MHLRPISLRKPEIYLGVALAIAPATLLLKVAAYHRAGGAGFLADSVETLTNLLTAAIGAYGAFWARQPRDLDHPYGHGKIDDLISGVQALLVGGSGLLLGYTILTGHFTRLRYEPQAVLYNGAALSLNLILSIWLYKGAYALGSQILRSEAWHLFSDVLSSLLVLIASFGVWWGWSPFIDQGVGILMSLLIIGGAAQIIHGSALRLIDTQDPRLLRRVVTALQNHRRSSWIDIHNLRLQRYGKKIHIDGHITLPWYWDLREAHAEIKRIEQALQSEMGSEVEFFWHTDPCEPVCCEYCEVAECRFRQAPFQRRLSFTAEALFVDRKGLR